MKAERRHELQDNELANWLGQYVEQNIDKATAQLKPGTPKHTLAELIDFYIKDNDPDGTKVNHLKW